MNKITDAEYGWKEKGSNYWLDRKPIKGEIQFTTSSGHLIEMNDNDFEIPIPELPSWSDKKFDFNIPNSKLPLPKIQFTCSKLDWQ